MEQLKDWTCGEDTRTLLDEALRKNAEGVMDVLLPAFALDLADSDVPRLLGLFA